MRILSKYKDYWHYLTGVYGIDNKIIYDITDGYGVIDNQPTTNTLGKIIYPSTLELHICGTKYLGVWDDGCFRWTNEYLRDLYIKYYMEKLHDVYPYVWMPEIADYIFIKSDNQPYWRQFKPDKLPPIKDTVGVTSKYNEHYKCPVLWIRRYRTTEDINYNPILYKTNIQSVLPAEDIFLKITNFLSYKEPEINTSPTDMNRFESKGFDKKSSFRKM